MQFVLHHLKKLSSHSVARNAGALGVMQIANYAVPLLLLPFLTRQLGAEAFGVVAITLASIQLAFVLTDYGFSLSATHSISINRENKQFVNEKIAAIFGAKVFLVIVASVLLVVIPASISEFREYLEFFVVAIIATVAQAFQPIWLFQGIEQMKNITLFTVLTKVVYAVLVLSLVSGPQDAIIVIYCWGAAQALGLIAALRLVYVAGYKVSIPDIEATVREFKEGAQFFWSRLAVSVYTSASILVVGSASAVQAAQYAVCEQVYRAGQNVTSPINTALYPYMAKNKDWKTFFRIVAVVGSIITLGSAFLSFYSEILLAFIFGEEYRAAAPVLMVFLCTTVINYFAIAFGYSAYSALGRIDVANKTVILGAVFHLTVLFNAYFLFQISAIAVAVVVLSTETVVTILRVVIFFRIKNRDR